MPFMRHPEGSGRELDRRRPLTLPASKCFLSKAIHTRHEYKGKERMIYFIVALLALLVALPPELGEQLARETLSALYAAMVSEALDARPLWQSREFL